ncbi:MAG: beta-Ala-His dipeptidase [Deltaproteobacteria bacterium]|nr:beta-Ala-His dipeptidase [Deltaproteobacteria bacterium]
MTNVFSKLEPTALWRYFELITQTPRCSGNEGPLGEKLTAIAREHGLDLRTDTVGNLVILIPAAEGCEAWPTVVLQGHLDMVCEKNNGVVHDFERDPIEVTREGDWLEAKDTTLGADNGIAIAAAMAMIDDAPPRHGALELLFTVDEERGLTGATHMGPEMLKGKLLLNLDSEEEGTVTVGCAGGGDTQMILPLEREAAPKGRWVARLSVGGLTGGHSGLDINKNRANALRCLGAALDHLNSACLSLRVVSLGGGNMRNAIPREAVATLLLDPTERERAETCCEDVLQALRVEFGVSDPELNLRLEVVDEAPGQVLAPDCARRAVALLLATPTQVTAMSREIPTLVETSTNLGVVEETEGGLRYTNCTRSSIGKALEGVRQGLKALGELAGAIVKLEPAYPGWAPNLASPLLARFQEVHLELFGKEAEVAALHAGLECGLIGEHVPGMDMISFGPTMVGVHAPGEKLHIGSAERFYHLLKALLLALEPPK